MDLIGEAIRRSGVDRKDLFITTRVSNGAQLNHTVREEFLRNIKEMGIDYVDLYSFIGQSPNYILIHGERWKG